MAKPGARWDDDWRHAILMDWLMTAPSAREPSTREKLAGVIGIDVRTMRTWAENPLFREEWQRRVSKVVGSPERAQAVMDTLYKSATDVTNRNQVQAAKLYLEATNAVKPPKMEVTVRRPTELTDDELDALLAQGVAEQRASQVAVSDSELTDAAEVHGLPAVASQRDED